jgi:hypothetical protein
MARRLELRTVTAGELNGAAQPVNLNYGEMMQQILQFGAPQGLTLDEVIKAVKAREPIDKAIAEGAEEVTLTDEQWSILVEKLGQFRFGFAHKLIAEFGEHIRNAPEIGTVAEPGAELAPERPADRRVPRGI